MPGVRSAARGTTRTGGTGTSGASATSGMDDTATAHARRARRARRGNAGNGTRGASVITSGAPHGTSAATAHRLEGAHALRHRYQ